jgi:hypothetical protein
MIPSYRLVMRSGPAAGTIFSLDKNEIFIGRDLNNDIVINDPEVSRRHARMYIQGANFVLEDLGSTNGTTVNGQRLMGPYILRPGELIIFGEHISLVFEPAQPDLDATIASVAPRVMPTVQVSNPVYQAPPPPIAQPRPPVYSGQVPGMVEPEEFPEKKKLPVWVIAVLILLLMIICVCVAALWYIDANNMWCSMFGWFFGPQACP